MRHSLFKSAAACAAAFMITSTTQAAVIYNGAAGTSPSSQGFFFFSDLPTGTSTTASGSTTLDTSADFNIRAGYTSVGAMTLDRAVGYNVRVDAHVLSSEIDTTSTSGPNRAGFSLIAISSDGLGIELAFRGNEIFAQEGGTAPALFTKAETASFNNLAAARRYDLRVIGNTYALTADGSPVLSGALRNYAAFTGFPDPYETPNLIFIGDDTTSARGSANFSYVSVGVPEPAAVATGGLSLIAVARRRR